MRIHYARPTYGKEEIDAATQALGDASQLVNGPKTKEFENKIAALFGKRFGVLVNSGSSANLLIVHALHLPYGGEVITPILTFSTTVAPIIQAGLVPAFVDVELDTFTIDSKKIESAISAQTKAMIIPNLIGNMPDWPRLRNIADRYGLILIEDSADTLASRYQNKPSGTFADVSTTSFYATHIITCGGVGGMVCCDDRDLYDKLRILRAWGRSSAKLDESEQIYERSNVKLVEESYDAKFFYEQLGYNFFISENNAAFGLEQLKRLPNFIKKRQINFSKLFQFFEKYKEWLILPRQKIGTETAWLAFPVVVRDNAPFTRKEFQKYLEMAGIQTRVIFSGNILYHPAFQNIQHRAAPDGYPIADMIMRGGLLLACHQGLSEEELEFIIRSCEKFLS